MAKKKLKKQPKKQPAQSDTKRFLVLIATPPGMTLPVPLRGRSRTGTDDEVWGWEFAVRAPDEDTAYEAALNWCSRFTNWDPEVGEIDQNGEAPILSTHGKLAPLT